MHLLKMEDYQKKWLIASGVSCFLGLVSFGFSSLYKKRAQRELGRYSDY